MTIKEAMQQYKKAQAAAAAAEKALKEASEATKEAVNRLSGSRFNPDRKNTPEYIAFMEAHEKEAAARTNYNIEKAVMLAASKNVCNVTANRLKEAITAAPEKFNKPVHYKVFIENIKNVVGDRFSIYGSYSGYSLYLYYFDAAGEREFYITDLENGKIKFDSNNLQQFENECNLAQIKKEAKKAVKDAEKLRKAAEKLKAAEKEIKSNYKSYIEYIMPSVNYSIIEDKYRLL